MNKKWLTSKGLKPILFIIAIILIVIGVMFYISQQDLGTPLEGGGIIYGDYNEEDYKMDKGLDYPENVKEELRKAGYKVKGDDVE